MRANIAAAARGDTPSNASAAAARPPSQSRSEHDRGTATSTPTGPELLRLADTWRASNALPSNGTSDRSSAAPRSRLTSFPVDPSSLEDYLARTEVDEERVSDHEQARQEEFQAYMRLRIMRNRENSGDATRGPFEFVGLGTAGPGNGSTSTPGPSFASSSANLEHPLNSDAPSFATQSGPSSLTPDLSASHLSERTQRQMRVFEGERRRALGLPNPAGSDAFFPDFLNESLSSQPRGPRLAPSLPQRVEPAVSGAQSGSSLSPASRGPMRHWRARPPFGGSAAVHPPRGSGTASLSRSIDALELAGYGTGSGRGEAGGGSSSDATARATTGSGETTAHGGWRARLNALSRQMVS